MFPGDLVSCWVPSFFVRDCLFLLWHKKIESLKGFNIGIERPFVFDPPLLNKTINFKVLFWYLMQFARFIGRCRILARPAEQDFRFL